MNPTLTNKNIHEIMDYNFNGDYFEKKKVDYLFI